MIRSLSILSVAVVVLLVVVTGRSNIAVETSTSMQPNPANGASVADNELVPVEPDMHDFMEDYFQPTFRRIQKLMRKEPEDVRTWKEIRSDAIILAESGNLLIGRHDEAVEDWNKFSVEVRDFGKKMYAATKEKDFENSKANFTSMIESCNACHKQFADGKHQLKVQ